jgi:hypothetical protein
MDGWLWGRLGLPASGCRLAHFQHYMYHSDNDTKQYIPIGMFVDRVNGSIRAGKMEAMAKHLVFRLEKFYR